MVFVRCLIVGMVEAATTSAVASAATPWNDCLPEDDTRLRTVITFAD